MDQLLLHAQAWWDAQRFDQREWQVAAWREQKLRHIQLHVAKALGKVVAAYDAGAISGTDALARVRDGEGRALNGAPCVGGCDGYSTC